MTKTLQIIMLAGSIAELILTIKDIRDRQNKLTGKWSDGPTLNTDVPRILRAERFI